MSIQNVVVIVAAGDFHSFKFPDTVSAKNFIDDVFENFEGAGVSVEVDGVAVDWILREDDLIIRRSCDLIH
jgi:hypothetical protein